MEYLELEFTKTASVDNNIYNMIRALINTLNEYISE